MDTIFFREKEVWWAALGVNIGFEQDSKDEEFRRPISMLKKFNKYAVLAVPLTTKIKYEKISFALIDKCISFSPRNPLSGNGQGLAREGDGRAVGNPRQSKDSPWRVVR